MRNFARRSGLAAIAIAALLGLLVTAAPAGARVFKIHGHSVKKNGKDLPNDACQGDMKVRFDLIVDKGRLESVENFESLDLNFPNATPPIPFGNPTGDCGPGFEGWNVWADHPPSGYTQTLEIVRRGPRNLFGASDVTYGNDGVTVLAAEDLFGSVHVVKKNHKFHITAEGHLFQAFSEAGLNFGGGATGKVFWEASN
jgi:hypothetical protein